MVTHKVKEFVDFNTRNLVKSQCIGKYSIINMINKKVLGHITTCLQSKVWGWALRWTGGFYIHISSKWGMVISKIVGPSMARYGKLLLMLSMGSYIASKSVLKITLNNPWSTLEFWLITNTVYILEVVVC